MAGARVRVSGDDRAGVGRKRRKKRKKRREKNRNLLASAPPAPPVGTSSSAGSSTYQFQLQFKFQSQSQRQPFQQRHTKPRLPKSSAEGRRASHNKLAHGRGARRRDSSPWHAHIPSSTPTRDDRVVCRCAQVHGTCPLLLDLELPSSMFHRDSTPRTRSWPAASAARPPLKRAHFRHGTTSIWYTTKSSLRFERGFFSSFHFFLSPVPPSLALLATSCTGFLPSSKPSHDSVKYRDDYEGPASALPARVLGIGSNSTLSVQPPNRQGHWLQKRIRASPCRHPSFALAQAAVSEAQPRAKIAIWRAILTEPLSLRPLSPDASRRAPRS